MYRALLVCNSNYDSRAGFSFLRGPRSDGALLRDALADPRTGLFQDRVRLLEDQTWTGMSEEINAFFAQGTPDDVLLFYFSGHGRSKYETLYLCGTNTNCDLMPSTAIPNHMLNDILKDSGAGTKILILDCCHGGAFKGDVLRRQFSARGVFVLAATSATGLARDAEADGEPSPFTAALVEGLTAGAEADGDGAVSLESLYRYLETRLSDPTPVRKFDGERTVRIACRPVVPPPRPEEPPPVPPPVVIAPAANDHPVPFLEGITTATTISAQRVAAFRAELREDIAAKMPSQLSATEFLHRAHLMVGGQLTRTGALLFGEEPTAVVRTALVTCIQYRGRNQDVWITKRELSGTIPEQIVEARDFVAELVRQGESPSPDSAASQTVYEYPMIAVREIIANAVAHRDYEHTEHCVHVQKYDDRLEIRNPGRWTAPELADGETWSLSQLQSGSHRRNFHLARILTWVRLVEGEGSGIPRAINECRKIGAPEPRVMQSNGVVIVTVYPRRPVIESTPPQAAAVPVESGRGTTVYVSATFTDLAECREAVYLATRRLEFNDVAMESYAAHRQRPLEKCLDDVARCDIYIGLFAWRYGFVPPGQDRSIGELEYREAVRLGKPCLIFLLHEDAPWPRALVDRGEAGGRIEALRAELAERHICGFFRNVDELSALVTAALANYGRGNPLPPSVRPRASGSLSEEDRQNYFERLRQCYSGVELDALTPAPTTDYLRIGLTQVFVEPTVREDARPELPKGWLRGSPAPNTAEMAQLRASYEAKASAMLFDVLADPTHRRVVLLGDPGAGKSAVTRFVALALAGVHPEQRLEPLYGHLPLMIELRSYLALVDDGRCESFLEYLDHRYRTDSLGLPMTALASYLDSGRPALVLFDGLDEVFEPRRRDELSHRIAAFAAEYPAVRVLVTARVVGYSRQVLTDAGFDHFTLEDFDEAQIAEFLSRWYELAIPGDPVDARIRRRRLLSAIRGSSAIRDLAGNPLLLTILAIIGKDQELPKERWRLYEHAANVLVEYWDADRHLRVYHGVADFLDTTDKKKLLRRLAYRMQSQHSGLHGNYIDHDQLSRLFEDYLVERYEHPRARAHALANSMIDQFHQRNFILGRYGQRAYGFVHRTFLEFFCAQAIVGKFQQGDPEWPRQRLDALFAEHWADPSWREVLRLVVGALDPQTAGELISLLATEVNRPWPPDAFPEPPWNLALAVQCLAEVRDLVGLEAVAESVLRQLILLVEHGVSIEDRATAELIEAEILPAVRVIGTKWPGRQVYLHWYRRRGVRISGESAFAARVAVLLATPHEGIEDLLDKTLGGTDDRRALLALIAGLTESAALPVSLGGRLGQGRRARCRALLVERARTDSHGAVRLAALDALVAQYGIDESLLELLQERARQDAFPGVRLMAVRTLGGRRTLQEPTRSLLIDVARGDRDNPVRRSAVEALASRYSGRAQTREFLIERLGTDTDPGVLEAVARALVNRPGIAAPVRELLIDRIRDEPIDAVRRCAVRLLGKHFIDDEVRELVQRRVRDDVDPGTRSAALQVLLDTVESGEALRRLLIERIDQDEDADLRLLAQRTLVARYGADPAVVRLLARQVRGDWDATIRRAAVADLIEHSSDEETRALLAGVARTDPAAGVRLAAAEALAEHFGTDARTRALIVEQATGERDTIVRLAATRTLIKLGEANEHLLDRVREDREPQIVREAARALLAWPTHRGAVHAALRQRAQQDTYAGMRLITIDLLVQSADTDPIVAALYIDRARHDPDPAVFRSAVLALTERFGGGEAVEDLLLVRAADGDGAIRLPAVEVLGTHFGADPRVRALLIDRARTDPDVQVRRAAVRRLGEELAGYAESQALLRELIHDPDWSVRRIAVNALGRYFGADDELRSLFIDRATNDPNPEFRRVAGQALTWLPDADPDQLPDIA